MTDTSVLVDVPVLIVGAGPTGLMLALWLARRGVPVRIIDKTAAPADYSRALGVHARTLEFYRQLGFADEAVAGGVMVSSANFWTRRKRRGRVPFRNIGEGLTPFPFVLDYAQDRHERLLIGQLDQIGVHVERSTELLGFAEESQVIRARLRSGKGEETCRCRYLAGCDGARSTVRTTANVGFAGGTYEHVFYVADVIARGPAIDDGIHVDLDWSDLLAVFDMKGDGHARLVGTIRTEAAERLRRDLTFDDVARRPIEQLGLVIERVNWFSTYHVSHRVADRFRVGRVFLLGDAAHVHSPVGAQGMNTGIGDAVNLAWKLAAVLGEGAPTSLLDTYETERIAFARQLVATTDRAFAFASRSGRLAAVVRTRVFPLAVSIVFRFRVARRFLFRTVSQLAITYRDSAISVGDAGEVQGGDRLPWIPMRGDTNGSGGDNLAPLSSIRWQAHVYGSAPNDLRRVCNELGLAFHVFPWRDAMRKAGLVRGALYVIRPDGYVAVADPDCRTDRLREFATRWMGRQPATRADDRAHRSASVPL